MRIHELEITDLRGIRHLVLKPEGKNLVIWGPNGSGKSAVVDAVEFLLQGRISRLAGTGTAGISLAAHGPHVDCTAATAQVRAVIEIPAVDGTFEVSRCLSSPNSVICPDEVRDQVDAILDAASAGQYVLARREILSFITATGGDRAAAIQKLLRLEGLEESRRLLVRSANAAARAAVVKESDLGNAYSVFAATAGLEWYGELEVLAVVNGARSALGGEPVDCLDPAAIVADLAKHGPATRDVHVLRLSELAPPLLERWSDDAAELSARAGQLHSVVVALCNDPVLLGRLDRHDLIEAGISQIPDDGSCPLCEAVWEPGALEAKLTSDLSALQSVCASRDEIWRQADEIRAIAKDLRMALQEASTLGVTLDLIPVESSLATWVTVLDEYDDALERLLSRIDSGSPVGSTPPAVFNTAVDAALLEGLIDKAKELNPDVTPEQKASELLGRLSENLKTIRSAQSNLDEASRLAARMKCLSESFTAASNEVLNELYESVKNRFVELYSRLHADDGEDDFTAVLARDEAALQFEVDFFNRGMHPPHALHSEGHQDSMGVCLYLALAERVNSGLINLVVLDDVVMSVDAGHRKRLARLLKDEFASTQFVITTHERAWAQQLKSEGVAAGEGLVQFCDWSVESGPRQNEEDVWSKIDSCLDADDVRGAASYLRGSMEEFFAEACENLEASVVYRGTGGYTLGDFLPAAWSRYTRLLKNAKAAANSWGDVASVETLTETQSVALQCYESTTAEGWAVNKGVHYDQWVSLSSSDLRDVVAAYRDLRDVFVCSSCVRPLRVARVGMTPVSVQCPCRQVDWNLEQKQ